MALIKSISGIRGTIGGKVGENLTPMDVVQFVSAFVTFLQKDDQPLTLVIGRDSRVSGEIINQLACSTMRSMGANVIDLGLSTTPTVEMAVVKHHADGGIILTASHNPMEWNALKLLNAAGEFISAEDGKRVLEIIAKQEYTFAPINRLGTYVQYDQAIDDHIDAILDLDLVQVEAIQNANFSVILDCVNSTGGIALPKLLDRLGVKQVKVLNGEPTGIFSHNPEPLAKHLNGISDAMKRGKYQVGFVVDPDVDRLAIISEDGSMFVEEYTLVAVADYILRHTPGNTVSNLSSSRALRDITQKYGMSYQASAVGEVNVVEKMKETQAVIGGEGNGGVIYPALHYGRDALVGIALFLSYMAEMNMDCTALRKRFPQYVISKNKIELRPGMDVPRILKHIADIYADHDVNTTDGVKIDFENGWVHLRPSNTEPIIRIYAEGQTEKLADNMANKIIADIREFLQTNKK